jgi:protein-S-isoprenylcysteine O-methyltransferase Ste14
MVGRQFFPNAILALWLVADAARLSVLFNPYSIRPEEVLLAVALLAAAIFSLIRQAPTSRDCRPLTVVLATCAAALPTLFFWVADPFAETLEISRALRVVACSIMLISIWHLRTNFSLLPQFRTLTRTGPYRIVRHPIYASYIIFDASLVLETASPFLAVFWLFELYMFWVRAKLEEKLLIRDCATFVQYQRDVRFLFLPFLL